MKEQICFADADLPFHVWVREGSAGRGFRWVLRHAADLDRGPAAPRSGAAGDVAPGRRPGAPL